MVCLGFEPRAAGWKAQTNPLSYGGTPSQCIFSWIKQLYEHSTYLQVLLRICFNNIFTILIITTSISSSSSVAHFQRQVLSALLKHFPGTGPIKILQRKFYATQFFKHFDWLKIISIQSKCLKNRVA